MKVLTILGLSIIMAAAVHAGSPAATGHQALKSEVLAMLQSSMEKFQHGDHEGLAHRFTPDGSLKMPGQATIAGHEALRKHYARALQSEIISFDSAIVSLEFSESGDLGVLSTEFRAVLSTPGGPVDNSGVILMVLKKTDGDWKIFAENVSAGPVSAFD